MRRPGLVRRLALAIVASLLAVPAARGATLDWHATEFVLTPPATPAGGFAAGAFAFDLVNEGQLAHQLSVTGPGLPAAGLRWPATNGHTTSPARTVALAAGRYHFYCAIHPEAMNRDVDVRGVPGTPSATTGIAASVRGDRAVLHGLAGPNGAAGTARFEISTDPALAGAASTAPVRLAPAFTRLPVHITAARLAASTTYYYALAVRTARGGVRGAIRRFRTGRPDRTRPRVAIAAPVCPRHADAAACRAYRRRPAAWRVVRGTAADPGRASSGVARVEVGLVQRARGACLVLTRAGIVRRSCRGARFTFVTARLRRGHFDLRVRGVVAGRWELRVRATDAAGNRANAGRVLQLVSA